MHDSQKLSYVYCIFVHLELAGLTLYQNVMDIVIPPFGKDSM